MALPQTSDSMANVLRLQGLKNVSGRRKVLPGAQFLQQMEDVNPDVSGVSQPMPEANLPELEMGNELTPQSYDVRANQVMNPEEAPPQEPLAQEAPAEEAESLWTRFGRALAMHSQMGKIPSGQQPQAAPQTPPIETQEVDLQEGLPPVSASQQEYQGPKAPESSPGMWGAIADYFNPKKREEMASYNQELMKDARLRAQGQNPQEIRQQEQAQFAQAQQLDQEELNRAQENPWEVAVYGATDQFAKQPELVREFQEYTGLDFTPQIEAETKKYEEVMSDMEKGVNAEEKGYDEQAKRIRERIERNQATDADKFYIGLALLMPLLVAGLFGKEAGLNALGGTAEGFAKILGNKQKAIADDEALLAEVNKNKGALDFKRGELEIEKLKIPESIRKNLPKDEKEDLKGMNIVTMKNGPDGEVIGAGPEVFPDLVANLQYWNTPKKREKMTEEAHKLNSDKKFMRQANLSTKQVIDAAKQIKDPSWFGKALAIGMSEGIDAGGVSLGPNSIKKAYKNGILGTPPMIKDENGRTVNAAVYLDAKIEQIKDAYRRNEQMRAMTHTVANHVSAMIENPLYSGLTSDDLITQMLILRDRSQQLFAESVEGAGFYPQPIMDEFGKENRKLYKGLNQREEQAQLELDKQKLLQGE
jgi:hypothetical protein